jgi:hypothetical protein
MGKIFSAKLLQDLQCNMGCMGAGNVIQKYHFLCEKAKKFNVDVSVRLLGVVQ